MSAGKPNENHFTFVGDCSAELTGIKNKCVKDVYDDLAVYISNIVYNCAGSLFFYFFLNLFRAKNANM